MSIYSKEELEAMEALDKLSNAPPENENNNPLPEKGGDSPISEENSVSSTEENSVSSTEENSVSSTEENSETTTQEEDNKNAIKEAFWAEELGFPDLLSNFIYDNKFTKVDVLSLGIDLKDHLSVYKGLVELKKKSFDVYDGIAKDDFLRTHALETLVTGYTEVENLLKNLKNETIAYQNQLSSLDTLLSDHVEVKKAEIDKSVEKLQTQVDTIHAMALNTVAIAMQEQVKVFTESIEKEKEERREFFEEEYGKLEKGINKAVENANIKNLMNKQVILIFLAMVFSQAIIFSMLYIFLK